MRWIILGLALVLGTPALANGECSADYTATAVRAQVIETGATLTEYTGSMSAAIMVVLLEAFGPPPFEPDVDMIFAAQLQGRVSLGFFKEDCYLGYATVPVGVWRELLSRAGGRGV